MTDGNVKLSVWELFSNTETLESKIQRYQRANNVRLYCSDSRSVAATAARYDNFLSGH